MQTITLITLFNNSYKTNIKINQSLQVTTITQNFYKSGKKKGFQVQIINIIFLTMI